VKITGLADQAQRERLRSELDTTFFVQAGAGTGKTSEIVSRVVALVAAEKLLAREIVAITFTEAAAAELRARIREGLEEAVDSPMSAEARERCAAAAREINEAAIDTIHAFAGSLLRTFPLEAGLPPNFEMLDEIQQDAELGEQFRAYFDALGSGPDRDVARRALLLGLAPDQLATLMRGLHDHYDLLTPAPPWPAAPAAEDAVAGAATIARMIERLTRELLPEMSAEPIARTLTGLGVVADRLATASTEEQALEATRLVERIEGKSAGNMGEWKERYGAGADATLRTLKGGLRDIEQRARDILEAHKRAVLTSLLGSMRRAVLESADDRKRRGVATFHDLLTWARDLLRDDLEVRRRAQQRWMRVFIDECQDTDPLQAEIAFYLASEVGATATDWRSLPLVPGKLCVVGDPKQSIYRFRRADIALYQTVEARMGGSLELTQNFRSVPRILEFVNAHYSQHMQHALAVQPAYIPLAAEAADTATGLWTFGAALDADQPAVREAEAVGVARTARRAVDEDWEVSDGKGTARQRRPARFSDIAVLIPSRTNLRRLERAFDREHVPYRIESGELIVQTQEVRDLVSCLRAIDDPSDEVALIAALRSVAFGISDVELLEWVESGGRWSFEFPGDGTVERIQSALAVLRELHLAKHRMTLPGLIQKVLDRRMLVAGAFGEARPRESWRRYRYVLDRARKFSVARSPTLRGFVDWIESLQNEQRRDVSSALAEEDEDAVRVLTVHGSKGLEFPVVILTGWGSTRAFSPPMVLADRVADALAVGIKNRYDDERTWTTANFAELERRERQLAEAETLRLSYVAATRARDHLVLSLYRKERETTAQAVALAATIEKLALARKVVIEPLPAPVVEIAGTAHEDIGAHSRSEEEWARARLERVNDLAGLRLLTATGLKEGGKVSGDHEEAKPRYPRGRAATALGRAVHAVLQAVDLASLDGVERLARVQAAVEGVPERADEVERLVRSACESEAVRRAVASGRYLREVPVGARIDGAILEGFIDLLYLDAGVAVVVDYKTDKITASDVPERAASYGLQGAAYAWLVAETLHIPVRAVEFVFASAGVTHRIEDLAGELAALRSAVVADGKSAVTGT